MIWERGSNIYIFICHSPDFVQLYFFSSQGNSICFVASFLIWLPFKQKVLLNKNKNTVLEVSAKV